MPRGRLSERDELGASKGLQGLRERLAGESSIDMASCVRFGVRLVVRCETKRKIKIKYYYFEIKIDKKSIKMLLKLWELKIYDKIALVYHWH